MTVDEGNARLSYVFFASGFDRADIAQEARVAMLCAKPENERAAVGRALRGEPIRRHEKAGGRRWVVRAIDGTAFGRESHRVTWHRAWREVLMAVGVLFDAPEGSQAMYDALTEKIFGTLQPATTPEGLIIHTAGPLPDGGWRVFDVWESVEAFWRFFDAQLLPAAQELGQEPTSARPEFFSIHNVFGKDA